MLIGAVSSKAETRGSRTIVRRLGFLDGRFHLLCQPSEHYNAQQNHPRHQRDNQPVSIAVHSCAVPLHGVKVKRHKRTWRAGTLDMST